MITCKLFSLALKAQLSLDRSRLLLGLWLGLNLSFSFRLGYCFIASSLGNIEARQKESLTRRHIVSATHLFLLSFGSSIEVSNITNSPSFRHKGVPTVVRSSCERDILKVQHKAHLGYALWKARVRFNSKTILLR
jgi:hypothetical protein